MAREKQQYSIPLSSANEHLLEELVILELISEDQKQILITEVGLSGGVLEQLLVEFSFIDEKTLSTVSAKLKGGAPVSLKNYPIETALLKKIPLSVAESCLAIPIAYQENSEGIVVAMHDVNDLQAYDTIRNFFPAHYHITPVMATRSEILEVIHCVNDSPDLQGLLDQKETLFETLSVEEEQGAISFVHQLIQEAVKQKASDIHLEPETIFVRVRYRCDGLLKVAFSFHQKLWSSVCVRIKVMSGMDIAETRRPQDGHFSLHVMGRNIDFRIATHPGVYGENIVIRILDKTNSLIPLEKLGYTQKHLSEIKTFMKNPEGLIIVTGPTGSGKTTTLYAMVALLDALQFNIMTLEEPVEYCLPYIRQTEIKEGGPLTFAEGMRSILRQDPDVILVGEMRDYETAHMAIRAAMTGHKVMTTLHTIDALAAIYRFCDFKIPLSLLAGHLSGIVAQRLVRLLCSNCKEKTEISSRKAETYQLWPQTSIYKACGCAKCEFSGYKGRKAVAEIITITDELEDMILKEAPYNEVKTQLEQQGFQTLFTQGIQLVLEGKTTIEEVHRVIGF